MKHYGWWINKKEKGWKSQGRKRAQKTSSWKKEKGVRSGVQVMVIDILFWGKRKEWDSSGSGTNLGLSNRTPRCFYLENTHRRVSEHLHKLGRMRCWSVGAWKKKRDQCLQESRQGRRVDQRASSPTVGLVSVLREVWVTKLESNTFALPVSPRLFLDPASNFDHVITKTGRKHRSRRTTKMARRKKNWF